MQSAHYPFKNFDPGILNTYEQFFHNSCDFLHLYRGHGDFQQEGISRNIRGYFTSDNKEPRQQTNM